MLSSGRYFRRARLGFRAILSEESRLLRPLATGMVLDVRQGHDE